MEPMKIEKIINLFNCSFCNELFKVPILLPCGETICQKDLDVLKSSHNDSIINCCFCDKQHHRPPDDFPIIKRIVDLIELGNDRINFGKTFEHGKNLLKDLDRTIKECEFINSEPSYYIYTYLHELKNQCDIRRENLKLEIDNHFDQILNEIEMYRIECEEIARNSSVITNKLQGYQLNLNDWKKAYDTVNLQEEIRDQVILRAKLSKLKLDIELNTLKQNLLQNKSITIDADQVVDKNLFGTLKIEEVQKEKNTDNILFKYKLKNFTNFKMYNQSDAYSFKYSTGDLKWLIYLKHKHDGFMDCHLLCDNLKNRTVDADFQIDLVNANDLTKKYSKSTSHRFKADSSNWGWNKYIKFDDLLNGGFYNTQTDTITLEVLVSIKSIN